MIRTLRALALGDTRRRRGYIIIMRGTNLRSVEEKNNNNDTKGEKEEAASPKMIRLVGQSRALRGLGLIFVYFFRFRSLMYR